MTLQLTLASVTIHDRRLDVFGSVNRALGHVCDHMLTANETYWWGLLAPSYRKWIPNLADAGSRHAFAAKLWRDPTPTEAQEAYDQYAAEISRSLPEAECPGWHWKESAGRRETFCGLGLSGLLIGWTRLRVNTAFLPLGWPCDMVSYDIAARRAKPLPREPASPRWHMPAADAKQRYKLFESCANRFRDKYARKQNKRGIAVHVTASGGVLQAVPAFPTWLDEWKKARQTEPAGCVKGAEP